MDKVTELFDSGTKLNVMSKDLETGRVEFKPIKAAAQTKKNQRIIKITDVNTGKFVKCTLDHRIFTKNRGWVEAQFITETDKLDIH